MAANNETRILKSTTLEELRQKSNEVSLHLGDNALIDSRILDKTVEYTATASQTLFTSGALRFELKPEETIDDVSAGESFNVGLVKVFQDGTELVQGIAAGQFKVPNYVGSITLSNISSAADVDEFIEDADCIIATDGAGSALRKSYYLGKKFLFRFSQDLLTHGYKELSILPTKEGDYKTYKNALHIWPRGDFMIIALPNLDGSFTVTLFLSYNEGEYNFNNLTTPEIVTEFFKKEFPDALELMPNLVDDFFENPTAPLGTVKCSPWHYKGNTLLMGDSAHAIVPFYGQGMNASFEDVVEFDTVLDKHEGDWETIFSDYEKTRKKDTDAIADLAIDNFHEMKDHVGQAIFQEKRKIEMTLEKEFPNAYSSKYSLVTFNEHIGYRDAMLRGRAQDKAILNMLSDGVISIDDDIKEILDKVKTETEAILEDDKIA